ncbi:MAG: LysR family transcriptional regulator [Lachnospiraceae bacterium]|nr:LysR family transcriptional regulator [Lachnospiraceae bacterium]
MTIRHLKIFITVYQKESITKAAEALHMTQPTVTRAIQELEEHYARQLFERIHRKLYITEAGKRLYPQALHIAAALDQMEKDMTGWDESGSLRIGAGTTLGCVLLPRVLSEFQKIHPLLTLRSIVTDKTHLQSMLLHNEIDFALIEGAPEEPSLKKVYIGKDRMILLLPKSHPLSIKDEITIQDISEQPIIVSEEGSASRTFMENLFSIHGLRLTPVMESGSMPAILQAVQAGIGIALIPEKIVALFGKKDSLTERNLPYELLVRENHIVWHENKYISKSLREFIELVRECGAKALA